MPQLHIIHCYLAVSSLAGGELGFLLPVRFDSDAEMVMQVNGEEPRHVWSHSGTGSGWRINPMSYTWWLHPSDFNQYNRVGKGTVRLQLQSCRNGGAGECLYVSYGSWSLVSSVRD